jgi:type II secretory pathway pseudopilin PulG
MRAIYRTSLLVFVLLLVVAACALPGLPLVDPNAQSTSLAQTLAVIIAATQQAVSAASSPTSLPTASATVTFIPGLPTQTPVETDTATPAFTSTSLLPMISVSIPTNCRSGPGKIYDQVGALLVGKTVQVYARDPSGMYWYIRNPDSTNEYCWVWGEYATLSGLTSILPIYTPPPTPTATATPLPSFDSSYSGLVVCTGWWPEIRIKNTGLVTFKSVGISLKDTVTSTSVYNSSDGFNDNPDCLTSSSRKTLLPGKSVTVSAPGFTYDPTGHKLNATITLCSDTGQSGSCVSDTISFTP